ncbi:MAG: hypothetical protein C6W57_04160 [Caldibacillus debilis]|nr:MAG: hypothetical protein BAA03_04125 [Caldibacillus debilis]REJ18075.1 MAG: hypothetical protein C6W57_04160 [Caldibacillus debilis]
MDQTGQERIPPIFQSPPCRSIFISNLRKIVMICSPLGRQMKKNLFIEWGVFYAKKIIFT